MADTFLDRFKKNFLGGLPTLTGPTTGFLRGRLGTISSASELGQRGLKAVTSPVIPKEKQQKDLATIPKELTEPRTTAEKAGDAIGSVAEFFVPAGTAFRAQKAAKQTIGATKLPKAVKSLLGVGAEGAVGAAELGAVGSVQEGKVGPEAKSLALAGAAFPFVAAPITGAAKTIARKLSKSKTFMDIVDRARVKLQDRFLPVRRAQEKFTKDQIKLSDEADIVLNEELYHGRLAEKLRQFKDDVVKPVIGEIRETTRVIGNEGKSRELINEYLHALHAPERNKLLGPRAAGISNAEAKAQLAKIEKLKEFPQIKQAASRLQALADQLPEFLLQNDLIKKETFDSLRKSYKNYVPLNRILDDEQGFAKVLGTGKGFDIKGPEFFRAKGSLKKVDDIFVSVVENWQKAIARAEKNKVAKSVLSFIDEVPEQDIFELVRGVPQKAKTAGEEFVFSRAPQAKDVITAKVDGVSKFIKIKDEKVAKALKNMGVENAGIFIKLFGPFTRMFSAINTSFNPEFLATNFTKDIQQSTLNLVNELGPASSAAAAGNVFRGQKGIMDALRGKNTEMARLYKDLVEEGGTTAFFKFENRDSIGKSIQKMQNELSRSAIGSAIRSPGKILDGIKALNEVVENGIRLSAYEQALKGGFTKSRAAQIAKNATVNFNKKGEWGSVINSLFAFANASIQGSFRTFKALSNEKTATPLIATIVGPTLALRRWNEAIDPEGYKKIPDWEKESNYIMMTGPDQYIKIPVPWGWNVFKVAADNAYDFYRGDVSGKDSLKRTANALFNAYNPLGAQDLFRTFIPTLARPRADVKLNETWYGAPIRPKNFQDVKESLNYFDTTNPIFIDVAKLLSRSTGGKGAKEGFVEMSPEDVEYLWNQYTGGMMRFIGRSTRIARALDGEGEQAADIPIRDVPFARRFLGETNDEQYNKNIIFETLDSAKEEILKEEDRDRLKESLRKELAAKRIDKKKANDRLKEFDRWQTDLRDVDSALKFIQSRKLEGDRLDKFIEALQDKDFMKAKDKDKFNKTQIKILKSLL